MKPSPSVPLVVDSIWARHGGHSRLSARVAATATRRIAKRWLSPFAANPFARESSLLHRIGRSRRGRFVCAAAALTTMATARLDAANTADSFTMGTDLYTGSWSNGLPTITSDAVFNTGFPTAAATFTLSQSITVGSLDDLNQKPVTITSTGSNGVITLGGPGELGNSLSGNSAADSTADLIYVASGASLTLGSGPVGLSLALGQTGDFDVVGALKIIAPISGANGINLTGGGTASLTGSSTFTGGISISGSTLQIQTNTAGLGTASNVLNFATTGTLQFTGGTTIVQAITIPTNSTAIIDTNGNIDALGNSTGGGFSGAGGFVKTGAGTLSLGTNNLSFTGAFTINAGTVSAGNIKDLGTLAGGLTINNTGVFYYSSTQLPGSFAGTFSTTLGAQAGDVATINVAGTQVGTESLAFAGPIKGPGTLNKVGVGPLILSGTNTYTGGTTINGGNFVVNGTLSPSGVVTVGGGGTLSGNGTVGGTVTVQDGGTITAGTIVAGTATTPTGSAIGALSTGAETWNSNGSYLAKVSAGAGSSTDELTMFGLMVESTTTAPFNIDLVSLGSTTLVNNQQLILAEIKGGAQGSFNVADLYLSTTNVSAPAGDSIYLMDNASGGNDFLIAEAEPTATPEPTSVLLLSAATFPMLLGRRRRNVLHVQ